MIDTVDSRKEIGFPGKKEDWVEATAVFDEHSLRIAGHPVMEDWEQGYMQRLAEIASLDGGRVLEVGYGMGLSARAIQSLEVAEHVIIECHPEVIRKCMEDFPSAIAQNRIHLLTGFWEDVTPMLEDKSFDGILFDTYPLREDDIHRNHFPFFKEAHRLLKPGGVFTYYSDEVTYFSPSHLANLEEAGFRKDDVKYEVCKVSPPKGCEYWQDKTILVPIVRKAA